MTRFSSLKVAPAASSVVPTVIPQKRSSVPTMCRSSQCFYQAASHYPAGATSCKIELQRVGEPSSGQSQNLEVEMMQSNGTTVHSTLNSISPDLDTTDAVSNKYKRYSHNPNNCAGQTRWIRFRTQST
ncbi:MAG: hypothetical protein H7Y20_04735 [Bryobacteraceae bacterium]|nr:hypothetical protein [Bryobacteraceae bacterium]